MQPTAWSSEQNYTSYAVQHPAAPFIPSALDTDFGNLEVTISQILSNLALIQRDDGQLQNGIVTVNSLGTDTKNLIGGWNPRGVWTPATNYAVKDMVTPAGGTATYVASVAHTSSAAFSIDNVAGKWQPVNGAGSNVMVSVKDFGAKGDGVTDDTNAINAAITALASGTISFPAPGTYMTTGNLTVSATGVLVTGPGAIVKLMGGANHPVFIIAGAHSGVSGITIDGTRASNGAPGATPNAGVYITGNDAFVVRTRIINCQGGGIYIASSARARTSNNEITGCSSPVVVVVSSDCIIDANVCDSNDFGIFIYNNGNAGTPSPRNIVTANVVSSCTSTSSGLGQSACISLTGAPDSIVANNVCRDSAFLRGIECFSGSTGSVITGNQVLRNGASSGASGIDTGPDDHLTITGNRVEANGGAGIFLSGVKYSIVANNICRNNAQNATARASGGANGITMNEDSGVGTDPVTDNIITGNHCIDTQVSKTQPFGIKQWQGIAAYYLRNIITGNNVRTNATAGFSLLSTTDSLFGNIYDSTIPTDGAFRTSGALQFSAIRNFSGASTTLTLNDYTLTCDVSAVNPMTVTLPAVSGTAGRHYIVRRVDNTANVLTVAAAGGETINGAASINIAGLKGFDIFSNGGGWFTTTT